MTKHEAYLQAKKEYPNSYEERWIDRTCEIYAKAFAEWSAAESYVKSRINKREVFWFKKDNQTEYTTEELLNKFDKNKISDYQPWG